MSETFTGLGGMGWKSNVNAYRSLGYDEKPYFWTFLEETDPDEQHKISQRVSPQLSYMLQQLWGEKRLASQPGLAKDRETSERITDYFSSHNLPDENWRGWDSSVNFDDIKVKTIRKEGLDEHDFGLGWYDQEYRMRNSQGTPGGLDYNMSTGNQPFPESDISYSQVNKIIRAGLRKLGLHAQSVQINIVPGNGGGTINLTIEAPGTTLSETINPMKVSI